MRTIVTLMLLIIWSEFAYGQQHLITVESMPTPPGYPLLGDNPFPALSGEERENAEKALSTARALASDCRCDRALRDYGIESLAELLKIEININLFDGRDSSLGLPYLDDMGHRETVRGHFKKRRGSTIAEVIPAIFTGRGKIIFLNSYFFSPTKDASTARYQRAIVLLHEVVHQFGNKSDLDFGGSLQLSALIIKGCLPGLSMERRLGNIINKK